MKRYFVYLMLYDNGYLYTGYTRQPPPADQTAFYQKGFQCQGHLEGTASTILRKLWPGSSS